MNLWIRDHFCHVRAFCSLSKLYWY
uniref:Uncharacterized protein n=1 Tax=Anguilla anguilla TaxID=7936 RepID=A0A0E9VT99_ANGAN